MKKIKKSHAFVYALFSLITIFVTSCGGGSGSSNTYSSVDHPRFLREKVAVSNFYQPSGIIHDSSPTFSWKAITNASNYRFGLEYTDTEENWQDYTVAPAEANCVTGNTCSYTPNDIQLVDGEEKVWWVQAKVAGKWQNWSSAFVFQYIDDSSVQTEASPISPAGVIATINPTFKWTKANGAVNYQFGYESAYMNDWKVYSVIANQANCQSGECSFTPVNSELQHNDAKTWWIRSQKNGIWSNWSQGSSFSIDLPSSSQRPFIIKAESEYKAIPILAQSSLHYNYDVDCDSDGVKEAKNITGSYRCTYSTDGIYRITFSGHFPRLRIERVTEIEQWGTQIWSSMKLSFPNAKNLKITATDNPDLSQVSDLSDMFFDSSFDPTYHNQSMIDWDVSHITNMRGMFRGTKNFNQYINSWDVSHVTDMSLMFFSSYDFNQDIGNWNIGNVSTLYGMFMSALNFNQDIGNWDTSSVTNMSSMFNDAKSFNQPIGNWDVSKVTNMELMLDGASFSSQNYDDLLIAWSTLPLSSNVNFGVGRHTKYSAAGSVARQYIIDNFNWRIVDAGRL